MLIPIIVATVSVTILLLAAGINIGRRAERSRRGGPLDLTGFRPTPGKNATGELRNDFVAAFDRLADESLKAFDEQPKRAVTRPIKTPQSNHNFAPPTNITDGSIGDLPCEIVETDQGRYVYSVWELSDVDRQAIANGWNIRLGVGWIGGYPPTSLGVTHEQEVADEGVEPVATRRAS